MFVELYVVASFCSDCLVLTNILFVFFQRYYSWTAAVYFVFCHSFYSCILYELLVFRYCPTFSSNWHSLFKTSAVHPASTFWTETLCIFINSFYSKKQLIASRCFLSNNLKNLFPVVRTNTAVSCFLMMNGAKQLCRTAYLYCTLWEEIELSFSLLYSLLYLRLKYWTCIVSLLS